ncbi:C40 family peptidase [Marinobacter salicampi]|uniref:C40 family peptidase n=1 Tax=Marinobacter salicampi TaxID=435907 RepID=UPI00140A7795|nr:NlpC/P60 family protein [Marinobacter salicampi]
MVRINSLFGYVAPVCGREGTHGWGCGHHLRLLLLAIAVLVLGGCASSGGLQGGGHQNLPHDTAMPEQASPAIEHLWQVFQRYEGAPYQYGGTTQDGFDCSGFIGTAYREALGRQLPRTTDQMLARGRPIELHEVRPGDLVFFRISGKDQHAGIYMGNHRFIHASTSSGVMESSLDSHYWRPRYSRARRF